MIEDKQVAGQSTGAKAGGGRCSVVVIGAGPYGLSAAAHLIQAGVDVRIFGEPMETWTRHMPKGMLLRSRWDASHIADPDRALGLGSYEAEFGLDRHPEPVPLARFAEYGLWFQEQAVPRLERRRVVQVYPGAHAFHVELDDGEVLMAERVVVAAGIIPFAWRPPQFASLPRELVSHTAEHSDLGVFKGRSVAVVGRGQSSIESAALLADGGARAEVYIREGDVRWLPAEDPIDDNNANFLSLAYRKTALGSPKKAWLVAASDLVHRLPYRARQRLVRHFTKPRASGWLMPRLSRVPITSGHPIRSASPRGDGLVLKLDDGRTREVDHLLLATGYRIDIERYTFLSPKLLGRVKTREGSPVLAAGFESSVPGLHFLGAPANLSFGPVNNFVAGTWASARGLTREVVGSHAPRAGFSW